MNFVQMGTYLLFHLADWSQVKKCHLVLNGIEKVPRSAVPSKVCLERVLHSDSAQGLQCTPSSPPTAVSPTKALTSASPIIQEEHLTNGNALKQTTSLNPSQPAKSPPPVPPKPKISRGTKSYSFDANTSSFTSADQARQDTKSNHPFTNTQHTQSPKGNEEKTSSHPQSTLVKHITLHMNEAEEVTTLLDDDDDECASDTSDDLHKVVRKRLSADITVLLDPPPENNVLILLLRPAEETQAWQFLSACMQVTQCGNKPLVMEGTGSMKKALTRTKPLYFSKNGSVQRI